MNWPKPRRVAGLLSLGLLLGASLLTAQPAMAHDIFPEQEDVYAGIYSEKPTGLDRLTLDIENNFLAVAFPGQPINRTIYIYDGRQCAYGKNYFYQRADIGPPEPNQDCNVRAGRGQYVFCKTPDGTGDCAVHYSQNFSKMAWTPLMVAANKFSYDASRDVSISYLITYFNNHAAARGRSNNYRVHTPAGSVGFIGSPTSEYRIGLQNRHVYDTIDTNIVAKFASDCQASGRVPLRWFDADSSQVAGSRPADDNISFSLRDETLGQDVLLHTAAGSSYNISGTTLGGQGYDTHYAWFDVQPNHKYIWTWRSVQGSNGIQLIPPYGGIGYDYPCRNQPGGQLSGVSCQLISGTAYDPDPDHRPRIQLHIYDAAGNLAYSFDAGKVDGNGNFNIRPDSLPVNFFDGRTYSVHGYAVNVGSTGSNQPLSGNGKTFGPCNREPEGSVDAINCDVSTDGSNLMVGWGADRDNGVQPLKSIHLYRDAPAAPPYSHGAALTGSERAPAPQGNLFLAYFRPDVNNYLGQPASNPATNKKFGYKIDLGAYSDYAVRDFYIYAIDNQYDGQGSSGQRVSRPLSAGNPARRPPCPTSCTFTPPSRIKLQDSFSSKLNARLGNFGRSYNYTATMIVRNLAGAEVERQVQTATVTAGNDATAQVWRLADSTPANTYRISVQYSLNTAGAIVTRNCDGAGGPPPTRFYKVNKPIVRVAGSDVMAGAVFPVEYGDSNCDAWPAGLRTRAAAAEIKTNGNNGHDKSLMYSGAHGQYGVFASGKVASANAAADHNFYGNNLFSRDKAGVNYPIKDAVFANSTHATEYGEFYKSGAVPCIDFVSQLEAQRQAAADRPVANWAQAKASSQDFVYLAGDLIVPAAGDSFTGSKVIFVEGDVRFSGSLRSASSYAGQDQIAYLMIITNKHIFINKAAVEVDANLVALTSFDVTGGIANGSGVIDTCADADGMTAGSFSGSLRTGSCDPRLTVNGSLMARRILWKRTFGTLGSSNNDVSDASCRIDDSAASVAARANLISRSQSCAAEVVDFWPGLYLNNPISRKGVGYSSVPSNTRELPPVF